jgi:hypothetical protein
VARPRKLWSHLTPGVKKRKLGFYRKQGLTDTQIKARYNTGKLGPQSTARGHANSPEKPDRALRNPERYKEYLKKHKTPIDFIDVAPGEPPLIIDRLSIQDMAYINFVQQLGDYLKFNFKTVRRNCERMTDQEAQWTAKATGEEIRSRARMTIPNNPWYYH